MGKVYVDSEIDSFYSSTSEKDRLKYGLGPLEFERNKELIQRYLSDKCLTIIDVGGGPGIYSAWLANMGHQVHLVDPVEKHILQAEKKAAKLKKPFKCYQGEAQQLDLPGDFADLVICHGPLYHLQSEEERINAITESARVLKPSGIFLGFAINYMATTLVGLIQGAIHNPELLKMCKEEILTGRHNAPESMPGILPKAFYHKPQQLQDEVEKAGLSVIETSAVEGIIWMEKNYFESLYNSQKKNNLFELLKLTENDMNLLSFSPHIMISARKA